MSNNKIVSLEEHRAIQQFLYQEARLLDHRKFNEWIALLDESIRYYMPNRIVRKPSDKKDPWDLEDELSKDDELAMLSDNILSLSVKALRLTEGLSFSENPMSRTVRLISNIEVEAADKDDTYKVYSNFHVNRTRAETDCHDFYGSRQDIIVRKEQGFYILERRIVLNATVLNSPNISIFL